MLRKYLCILLFLCSVTNMLGQRANDCVDAVVVCGNSTINTNVSGFGTQELDNSANPCFFQEVNSLWLQLNIAVTGTLEFTTVSYTHLTLPTILLV